MRPMLSTLVLAIIVVGCSNAQPPITVNVSQPAPHTVDSQTTPSITPALATPYPEKADVERLLHRAREQEKNGQFHSALDLVNQALQVDANSPSATTMEGHLEAIITKI